ncbi:hypothetical protein RUM44_005504 [Polyplax serrata]|uniref:Uncharacterized protein n=1 Tax=Polyplax serrata TaxID=468196 RepID=A0ABR1AEV1_POLSC
MSAEVNCAEHSRSVPLRLNIPSKIPIHNNENNIIRIHRDALFSLRVTSLMHDFDCERQDKWEEKKEQSRQRG